MGEFLKGMKFVHDNKDLIRKIIVAKVKKYALIGVAIVIGMCLLAGCVLVIFQEVQDKAAKVAKSVSSIFSIQKTQNGDNYYSFGTSDLQKLENTLEDMGIDLESMGLDLKSGHLQNYIKAELATGLPKILTDDQKEAIEKDIEEFNKTQEDEKGLLPDDEGSTDGSSADTGVASVADGFTAVTGHEADGYRSVTKVGNRVYNNLKQYEGSYAETHYWSNTIHTSGCGPTSIAICLSGYGQNLTPRNVIDQCNLSYSSPSIMSDALTKLGVKNSLVDNGFGSDAKSTSEDANILRNQFKADKPVMLSLKAGNKFTKGGHYICLLGENSDGSIIVSDPGHNDDTTKQLIAGETIESMLDNYINAYILIDSDAVDTTGVSGGGAARTGKQDYVDGIITVVRKDEDGNSKELKYMKEEEFTEKVNTGDDSVKDYFTLDSKWTMYVATSTDVYKDGSLESHKLSKQTISYQNAVSKYSMPFEFLTSICTVTQSPSWVDALANIALKDTTLQIVVQDGHRTTETTETTTIEREVHEEVPDDYIDSDTGETVHNTKIESKTETETHTTVSKVIAQNIVAYLGQVDSWCAKGSLEYTKQDLQKSSTSNTTNDDSKVEEPLGSDETGSRIKSYKVDTTVNTEVQAYKKGKSTMEISPDKFLGTLKNEKGKYEVGAKYDKDGKKVLYADLTGYARQPIDNILSASDWLFSLMEKSERCQNQEMVFKYFLYLYTGRDFGVTEIDPSIFGISDLTTSKTGGMKGGDAFTKYMQNWENDALYSYMYDGASFSSYIGKYASEDKSQYIVHNDGSNNPTVGYGICLKYNIDRFSAYGVDVSGMSYGAGIDASICDKVYAEEMNTFREKVLADTSGVDLNDQQIDALTAVAYQYGNIGNFVSAYNSCGNTEALRDAFIVNGCTPFLNGYQGVKDRAAANWKLFNEGIYIDREGNQIIGSASGGGTMAEKAKECHEYIAGNGYSYGGGCSIPLSESSGRVVDCSGFVSWVCYEAGYSQFAGGQKSSYYFESNPDGFQVVTYDSIQPGDIMVYSGHVEIFAGFNESGQATVYNCGSNNSINATSPTYPSRDPSALVILLRA